MIFVAGHQRRFVLMTSCRGRTDDQRVLCFASQIAAVEPKDAWRCCSVRIRLVIFTDCRIACFESRSLQGHDCRRPVRSRRNRDPQSWGRIDDGLKPVRTAREFSRFDRHALLGIGRSNRQVLLADIGTYANQADDDCASADLGSCSSTRLADASEVYIVTM